MHTIGIFFFVSCSPHVSAFPSSFLTIPTSSFHWVGAKMLATSWSVSASSESLSYFWWQMWPPPSLHWRGLSSDGRFLVGLSHLCPLSSEAREEKKTWLSNAEFRDANMNLRFLNLHMNWQFNGIPLPSVTLRVFRKGFMGLCRITLASLLLAVKLFITLLPDREPALGLFLLQGVCFPPLLASPGEGVWVFGSAAVSDCLPVAGCCTDTSTGGRHELNPVALPAPSTTKLHWVEASHVSTMGCLAVWVPAFRVSLDVLHLHNSELWVWTAIWGESNWAVWLCISWILLPPALSWRATFSLNLLSPLKFILGFRSGVKSLGWGCLCFGFPCKLWFGFRLSAQQAWSIYEQAAWRLGMTVAWQWLETWQHSSS